MRRLTCSSLLAGTVGTAARSYWDPAAHQPECLFMDRKDLEQLYPTRKPKVTSGEYGYQRLTYWNVYLSPNPCMRLPHERRRLNPKKAEVVTVFGATGFLGAEIVKEMLAHPDIKTVRACTRYPTMIPAGSDLDKLLEANPDKLELHECDVTDRIQVNVAANGADTLIHCVDWHCEYANNSHFDIFVTGAVNVSWTARNVRAERVIFVNGLDATFASESGYSDFRARGEDAVGANFPDATLLRFGPLYGKNYRYKGLCKYLYLCPWHQSRCQPTWVTDAARAVVRCSRSRRSVRYKLDLGGPENMSHNEYALGMSKHFHSRFVLPMWKGLALSLGRLAGWVWPNAWCDDSWIYTWQLDQVNRSPAMFDRLAGWEHIEYSPHTMAQAAAVEMKGAPLVTMQELDAVYQTSEAQDVATLAEEEKASQAKGVHRAKAEPAFGRGDGMEMVADEIYPGQQFRIRPLADAKYPAQVKNPGPVAHQ
jgi:uncharacterized protein YbjT (DUF2867 family)